MASKASKANDAWKVLPHGPIEQLEPNLWRVEGSLPNMPLKRVMAIARTTAGELVIYNPIALEAAEMAQLEALGGRRGWSCPTAGTGSTARPTRCATPAPG
jgi:hypothetical protein